MLPLWLNIERLIHSLKTCVACVIGILLARLIGFPADQWIVITIIVVMCAQLYVGSVVQKAYLRFIGTVIGCIIATFVLMSFGNSSFIVACTIGISSFVFSYLATGPGNASFTGTLGAVTVAIIMLGQTPTATFAAERFLEISVGLLIAALVSQFFLPIHARTHLRRAQADTLRQLRLLYETLMVNPVPETTAFDYHELDEKIVQTLLKQRQLAKEAVPEPLGSSFDTTYFMQSLFCERDILRSMVFMHQALLQINQSTSPFLKMPGLKHYNDMVMHALESLQQVVKDNKPLQEQFHVPSLGYLKEDLQPLTGELSHDDLIYIDGFIFSAEILAQSLTKLARLYRTPIYEEKAEGAG